MMILAVAYRVLDSTLSWITNFDIQVSHLVALVHVHTTHGRELDAGFKVSAGLIVDREHRHGSVRQRLGPDLKVDVFMSVRQ